MSKRTPINGYRVICPWLACPEFNLKNANTAFGNEQQSLSDSMAKNGCVVVFECNHCPYVVASVGRMNNMAEYCKVNGIGFVGINANDPDNYPADSFENMVKRAEKGMPYAYLHDVTQVATHGAQCTPEFTCSILKEKSPIADGWMIALGIQIKLRRAN